MVSTSKILTVSYGTFSCTLEGFDDSFDTMKAIAEYFRDLSAGDRYFGAEPATPDADMLARIAEREISRHVEARDADGRIHLRAGPAAFPAMAALTKDTAAPAPASSDTAAPSPRDEDGRGATPQSAKPAAPTAAASAPAAAEPAPDRPASRANQSSSESIADKLRRIRAVAGPSGSAFSGSGYDDEDQVQEFAPDTATESPAADPAPAEVADTDLHADPEGAQADMEDDTAHVTDAEGDQPAAHLDSSEEQEPEDTAPAVNDATIEEARSEDEPQASGTEVDATMLSDDDMLARLSADAERADEAQNVFDDAIEPQDDDADASDDLDQLFAAIAADQPDELAADAPAEQPGGDDTLAQLLADSQPGGDMTEQETDASDAQAPAQTPPARPLDARVIKMKRADLEAALAGGSLEEETGAAPSDGGLSPEAEAELQRELAEVEAEITRARSAEKIDATAKDAAPEIADEAAQPTPQPKGEPAEDSDLPPEQAQETRIKTSRAERRRDQPAPDAQASRIFDEANTQLDEPESNKRRSAIQHLRAAVAATKAERRAGGAMTPGVDDQPYRKDLQSVVRPRRPQAVTAATPRPGTAAPARPAPLKLVAEQRVDAPAAPVRPRRITRADLAQPRPAPAGTSTAGATPRATPPAGRAEAPTGFAGYAEHVGANSLTDLLEAAAAYLADIEGTPQFSRPMLMQKLREAHEDDFSREDGLRSFGLLLRQGKLQKLKGGRFAVTDVTDFRHSA
ncbi:hypothetical protein [Roseovarius dicentrarchi]|uniref:hypothetical protein n=1 Tax=Roseovarius dicentrarchi TaxID=2250573 RepID=UPI000DEBAC6B|nr:hypothetical protein [Roseovarius dicentrarchi]